MAREIAVRWVKGIDPADQESLMQTMVADGWEVVGWGATAGTTEHGTETSGFMLYFGRDKAALIDAEVEAAVQKVAERVVPLNRAERRRGGRN